MNKVFVSLAAILLICTFSSSPCDADGTKVFLIGNSLTWDTVPTKLDGDVQWHVDCGKSLPFIHSNPGEPCVKSSTLWPSALSMKQYDILSLQVHYGSTLKQDAVTISELIQKQPDADVVIHTGWARSAERESEWTNEGKHPGTMMNHSRSYFDALISWLQKMHPDRTFRRTRAMDLLAVVQSDIESGKAPIDDVAELYRDKIHMDLATGRYLMHNAMRDAVGQPRSATGFERLDPEMKDYLDSVLDRGLKP